MAFKDLFTLGRLFSREAERIKNYVARTLEKTFQKIKIFSGKMIVLRKKKSGKFAFENLESFEIQKFYLAKL